MYSLHQEINFGTLQVVGYFRIIEKIAAPNDAGEIIIKCVWIKGEMSGKTFTVKKFSTENESLPDQMYFPPRMFVLGIEVLLSFSFVGALFGVAKFSWTYVSVQPFWKDAIQLF